MVFEEVPENAGEFVRHGSDGFGGSQAGFPSAEAFTQIIFAAPEALGGQTQGHGGAVLHVAGFDGDDFAAGDAVVWAKPQPGGEAFGGGEASDKIRSQFGEEDERGVDLESGHLGQIDAAKAMELGAGIKARFVALGFAMAGGRRRQRLRGGLAFKAAEVLFNLLITLADQLLVMLPGIQSLLKHEEVFGPPVALERTSDGIAGSFDAMIFECGQLLRIAFTREDRFQNGQTGDAGEIADDVVNLEVHLREGFLQVLHMAAGVAGEVGPMTQQ